MNWATANSCLPIVSLLMKRTAIVHIGLEKTGSTAIQRWLSANRLVLRKNGILMPSSIGYPNHTKLVAACLDDGAIDNIKSYQLFATGHTEKAFRRHVFAALQREIFSAHSDWRTLLISSELISSRLSSASEIERLLGQIQPHVDRIRFVVFLRRQDQLAVSRFSSILRSGHSGFDDIFVDYSPANFYQLPDGRSVSDDLFFYDFENILARFEGWPSTSINAYFYGSCNPIQVFAGLLELGSYAEVIAHERHNLALSAEAQYILSRLNAIKAVQFASGMRNDAYRRLQRRVEAEVLGKPRVVARSSAEEFLERYVEMNSRVLSRYGVRGHGFSSDFSAYPESVDYSVLPDQTADCLAAYRRQAERLPDVEPLPGLLKYKLKRAKAFFVDSLRVGRNKTGTNLLASKSFVKDGAS
jgi:hypothetical protein